MAISKIKIYRTNITPERNALVENIETYLYGLVPTYSNDNFQYQKLGLDLTTKIPVDQATIGNQSIGNYVSIEQDGKTWYYFIMNSAWKGVDTVELELSIDSVNTFQYDFHMTDKTSIKRQHADRFYPSTGNNVLVRRIDRETEGLAAPKEKASKTHLLQNGKELDWYLMYRTNKDLTVTDIANPISCYCFASERLVVEREAGPAKTFTPDDFATNRYYYLTDLDSPEGEMVVAGTTYKIGSLVQVPYTIETTTKPMTYTQAMLKMIEIYKTSAGVLEVTLYAVGRDNAPFVFKDNDTNNTQNFLASSMAVKTTTGNIVVNKGNFFRQTGTRWLFSGPYGVVANVKSVLPIDAGLTGNTVSSINDIDKTDSRIVKIIKLPYAPSNITYDTANQIWVFPAEWVYEAGLMRLKNDELSTQFESKVGEINLSELFLEVPAASRNVLNSKDISRESKLYHSDFYTKKLVYDSFTMDIPLEQMDLSQTTFTSPTVALSNTPIFFKPTNTINSKFAFKVDYDSFKNKLGTYRALGDYDNFLLINRNNEETIFSNDFVNYIRTGYNYDKKKIETSALKTTFGLSTTISNQLALGLQPAIAAKITDQRVGKRGTKAGAAAIGFSKAASSIAIASNLVSNIASGFITLAQGERDLQQKLQELQIQSSSVSGADDVDLLSYYNGNKLDLFVYDTKDYYKHLAYDLMFFGGYSHTQNELPNVNSRYWFNYIQCSPVFREEADTPYNDYLDDLRARYENGVTVYHRRNGVSTVYNWNQEKENWETWLAVAPTPNISVVETSTDYVITFTDVDPLGKWIDNGDTIYYQINITDKDGFGQGLRTTEAGQRTIRASKQSYHGIKKIAIRELNNIISQNSDWYTQNFNIS